MIRRPLGPAPPPVTNLVQTAARPASRNSQNGPGAHTELRAQVRKERENDKQQRQNENSSLSLSRDAPSQSSHKQVQSISHSSQTLSTSMSNQKVGNSSANQGDQSIHDISADQRVYQRSLQPCSVAMNSDNASNMSTSSQVSSSSSTGIVKKRSQTIEAQQLQQQQQQQFHQQVSAQQHVQLQQSQPPSQAPPQQQQLHHQRQESFVMPTDDTCSQNYSSFEVPDQPVSRVPASLSAHLTLLGLSSADDEQHFLSFLSSTNRLASTLCKPPSLPSTTSWPTNARIGRSTQPS